MFLTFFVFYDFSRRVKSGSAGGSLHRTPRRTKPSHCGCRSTPLEERKRHVIPTLLYLHKQVWPSHARYTGAPLHPEQLYSPPVVTTTDIALHLITAQLIKKRLARHIKHIPHRHKCGHECASGNQIRSTWRLQHATPTQSAVTSECPGHEPRNSLPARLGFTTHT